MSETLTPTDMEALKARMKSTWMAGDFDKIAQMILPAGAEFIARLGLAPGMRVLDVACGSGNLSIPAARTGADVTGVDIAVNLLEIARTRAQAEGLKIKFDEGDAEALPYPDKSFDVVMSMFGAMFAPRPEVVASELARVCRSGGRLAMANWTPTGVVGRMFKTTAAHVQPPPVPPPVLWGDETVATERLSRDFKDLRLTQRKLKFEMKMTPAETVEFYRTYFGPTKRAFDSLDEDGQAALKRDLEALWSELNQATDGTTLIEGEYLEVIAVRA